MPLSIRALSAGVALVLLTCVSADFSKFYSASNFRACMEAAQPSLNMVWPADNGYEEASLCPNVRNQVSHPTVVVYATSSAEVAQAVQCAAKWNVKVSATSGRHSFNNAGVMDGYVTVDLSNMTTIDLATSSDGRLTAWTGAGVTNGLLTANLITNGPPGVASLSGSCPSVGTGGYYLGGGMGVLSPKYGLGCDQLLAIEAVLANGTVITADAQNHSSLFWASCGGGPGLAIVTKYKVKVPVHTDPRVTQFTVWFPAWGDDFSAMSSVQKWITTKNGRNGLMLTGGMLMPASSSMGTPPVIGAGGLFLGGMEAAMKAINDSGLLSGGGIILDFAPLKEFPSFGAFMMDTYMSLMNDWNQALLVEIIGHTWDSSNQTHYDQFLQLALQPGSLVSSAKHKFWQWFALNSCWMVPEMSTTALKALLAFLDSPSDAECAATTMELSTETDYLCLAKSQGNLIKWNHFLMGAVAAKSSNATAFPHRKMLSPLCYEPSMPYGSYDSKGQLLPSATVTVGDVTVTYEPLKLLNAFTDRIEQFERALLSNVLKTGNYYNYIMPSLDQWQRRYWGSNYLLLRSVKASYDPHGVFSKPFTVGLPLKMPR